MKRYNSDMNRFRKSLLPQFSHKPIGKHTISKPTKTLKIDDLINIKEYEIKRKSEKSKE